MRPARSLQELGPYTAQRSWCDAPAPAAAAAEATALAPASSSRWGWLARAARFLAGGGGGVEASSATAPFAPASDPREMSPEPSRKRARMTMIQATPALSPLGVQFTPVPRSLAGQTRSGVRPPPPSWCPQGTAASAASSTAPASSGGPQAALAIGSGGEFWRVQLEAIYRQRNPYKLHKVPQLLAKHQGTEALLYRKVCLAYDLDPTRFYASSLTTWPEDAAEEAPDDAEEAERGVEEAADGASAEAAEAEERGRHEGATAAPVVGSAGDAAASSPARSSNPFAFTFSAEFRHKGIFGKLAALTKGGGGGGEIGSASGTSPFAVLAAAASFDAPAWRRDWAPVWPEADGNTEPREEEEEEASKENAAPRQKADPEVLASRRILKAKRALDSVEAMSQPPWASGLIGPLSRAAPRPQIAAR